MINTSFKTVDGNNHRIDTRGNHFINNRCVNPIKGQFILCEDGIHREATIGSTYPNVNTTIKN